jgi:hypothetical protein
MQPDTPPAPIGADALSVVAAFLLGEGPLQGVWYGERPEGERCKYWWRIHLRAAIASAAQAPQAVGMRVSDTGRVSVDPVALANSPEFLAQVAAVKRLREAQAAPAATNDCARSHPHEAMSAECQVRAVIAEMRSKEARGAEATEHELGEMADRLTQALEAYTAQPAPQQETADDVDGDAFRTAARLGLTLRFYGGCAQSSIPGTPSAYEVVGGADRAVAMREAVQRAAAVISKGGEVQRLEAPAARNAAERDALLQAAIDFIGTLTGMTPPPIEVAPPEVFAPFRAFVDRVQAITNEYSRPAPAAQGDALHELAFGEEAASVEIGPMRWTDDGDKSVTLHDASGGPALTLEVTDKSDMQPNAEVSGAGTASAGLPGYAGDSKGE